MEKSKRKILLVAYFIALAALLTLVTLFLIRELEITEDLIVKYIEIGVFVIFTALLTNEAILWYKNGKRGDSADLIVLGFLFITVYLLTDDILNSFIGALSIYLLVGIMELKEYEILNKILLITVITYNFVFIMGLINSILKKMNVLDPTNNIIRDSAFSFSIWIMLILGFIFFGRKYIVVFRFMSPEYLTMLLFLVAWLAVRGISMLFGESVLDWIYLILLSTNWLVYFISGPTLDLLLGIKKTDDENLIEIVEEVKNKLGIKGKVKVGFGKYPILNAFAYGAFFDKRIAIIADDINVIPKDEIKGIIAHELNHIKGKHTMILSLVSTIEIVIFWALGWPVTYYDFVFNPEGQKFGLGVFFVLNLAIMVFIYIFIRVMEAKADINTKKAGYGNELAKGLYNLEGFYASGREIGLDTMLLCDEKLLDYNRITNYSSTAEYLNKQMVSPGKMSLLSNLINSHPPSYHRIMAMYGEINPWKESLLPVTLLRKKNNEIFANKHVQSISKFKTMANSKFKEMFGIQEYDKYMEELRKKELYEIEIGKTFIYIDKHNLKIGLGTLADIEFKNDVCNPFIYKMNTFDQNAPNGQMIENFVKNSKLDANRDTSFEKLINYDTFYSKKSEKIPISEENQDEILERNKNLLLESSTNLSIIELNPQTTKFIQIELGASYYTADNKESRLIGIKLPDFDEKAEDSSPDNYKIKRSGFIKKIKQNAFYLFGDQEGLYVKPVLKYKLPFNLNLIENAVGKDIFQEDSGTLKICKLESIEKGKSLFENKIILSHYSAEPDKEQIIQELFFKDIIVKTNEFSISFHNEKMTWDFEKEILEFLKEGHIRTTIFLKKPINNQETGYIKHLEINEEDRKNDSDLIIDNIFGKEEIIPMQKIEAIIFSSETISITDKTKISIGEKFIQKISNWRKPNSSFSTLL